jgi:hypothetical protein
MATNSGIIRQRNETPALRSTVGRMSNLSERLLCLILLIPRSISNCLYSQRSAVASAVLNILARLSSGTRGKKGAALEVSVKLAVITKIINTNEIIPKRYKQVTFAIERITLIVFRRACYAFARITENDCVKNAKIVTGAMLKKRERLAACLVQRLTAIRFGHGQPSGIKRILTRLNNTLVDITLGRKGRKGRIPRAKYKGFTSSSKVNVFIATRILVQVIIAITGFHYLAADQIISKTYDYYALFVTLGSMTRCRGNGIVATCRRNSHYKGYV